MNTPSIDITPVGGGADMETAEIIQGLIKDIEYKSRADDAYDNAVNFAIKCGIGFMRVDHDYEDSRSFDQELNIQRMINPFSVLLDYNSIEPDGSDAMYCYVLDKMDREAYKEKYPDATSDASFTISEHYTCDNEKDEITLAEYFYIEEQEVTMALIDGEAVPLAPDEEIEIGMATRQAKMRIVHRVMLNGEEELERTTFPGEYIPIVPVYGEEAWMDGKRHVLSLIRRSKDAQRMVNYFSSMEVEFLMRSPKAAILAAEGTTEDYAEDYLNPDKAAVLRYKMTGADGKPAPPPQFIPPSPVQMRS